MLSPGIVICMTTIPCWRQPMLNSYLLARGPEEEGQPGTAGMKMICVAGPHSDQQGHQQEDNEHGHVHHGLLCSCSDLRSTNVYGPIPHTSCTHLTKEWVAMHTKVMLNMKLAACPGLHLVGQVRMKGKGISPQLPSCSSAHCLETCYVNTAVSK